MDNKIKSRTTGREYYIDRSVRIINPLQIASYLEAGVTLLDVYPGKDAKSGRPIIVGIFDRKESFPAYQKWCNHEL